MKRHKEFQYCIGIIEKSLSIWIFIEDNESGWNKEDFDWTSDEQYDNVLWCHLIKRSMILYQWKRSRNFGF